MSEIYLYLSQHPFWFKFPLIVCSFLFLYTGLFLYDSEQGLIQNRLEEWWCKLDDAASSALIRNLRIVQGSAIRFQAHLESRFGRKLFSFRSIGVSICWGMISAKFTVVIIGLLSGNPPIMIIGGELLGILLFWYLSKGPRIFPPNRHHLWFVAVVLTWISLIIMAYISGTLGNIINGPPPVPNASNQRIVRLGLAVIPLYTLGVLVSTAFTLVFVLVSRCSLQYITQSKSNARLIKATVLHSLLLLSAIWLHMVFIARFRTQTDFRDYIFLITTPIMGYAYWMTLGLGFMVAHMFFWAVMQRPLYALQRIGGERRSKLFVVVGLVLLGLAFPGVGEILKSSLSALKSVLT